MCESNTLHAPLILHLTVAAWRRAWPAEQKVGRHHGSGLSQAAASSDHSDEQELAGIMVGETTATF